MTKEEIKRAAENYQARCNAEHVQRYLGESAWADTDFTAGAEWMQGEMEKEACEFAEWIGRRYYHFAAGKWNENGKIVVVDNLKTTAELFDIFKQHKP